MPLNPRLSEYTDDPLYHFGLNKDMHLVESVDLNEKTLPELFGDTRIVCMGGSPLRAERFAKQLATEFPHFGVDPKKPRNFSLSPDRLHLYKIGPLLSISHGMGIGSIRIAIHEITKLLFYAGEDTRKILHNVEYIRIGTSGGIGADLGDVVLSRQAIHPRTLKPVDEIYRMGETYQYPAVFDPALRERIFASRGDITVIIGDTLTSNGFYEEEPNTHGALDEYTEEELHRDVPKLIAMGVRNVEMEAAALAGFCGPTRANIPAADICTVVDPIGVPIKSSKEELKTFSARAQQVVVNYIKSRLHEGTL
ncbi:hypothetical protein HYZ98_00900 [Candidatus Peregrinibacteria bacterium]|nr:hypothetical protein [Candidatus Peregrinibacteria bacterium]